jgi:glyoxylase-like metal-dependent hydrolase (beta-lactamase superfamily II)
MELYVRQLQLGPMENFVYLVGAQGAKETAIVDAAWDVEAAMRAAQEDGRVVTHALVSHHHFDHTNGIPDLLTHGKTRIYINDKDKESLHTDFRNEVIGVKAGDAVEVGPLKVHAFHTPGHTPGSTCWHAEGSLFAGDTVFVNACGRCDLAGGDPEQMFESLNKVSRLPEETKLYPGHDYGDVRVSTVGREKTHNPYFQKLNALTDFVSWRMRPRK